MRRLPVVALLLLHVAGASGAEAQSGEGGGGGGNALVAVGIRAYQDVELAAAASWLRRALADSTLTPADRIRALSYLGATEVIRGAGRRDSAAAAFRRLVLFDPSHRLDELVFPPLVARQFEEARRTIKAVTVVPGTGGDAGSALATVYPTSVHEIEARLVTEAGVVVRTIYVGPVVDSFALRWDGRDSAGVYLSAGRYRLTVASRPTVSGPIVRTVVVPLEIQLVVPDPLPQPPPLPASAFLPERTRGEGMRSLSLGLAAGGAVLVLPGLVAEGSKPSGGRFAVAGAVTVAGVVGLFTQRGKPILNNIVQNTVRRAEWQRRVAAVNAENERRRVAVRISVRAGKPSVVETP